MSNRHKKENVRIKVFTNEQILEGIEKIEEKDNIKVMDNAKKIGQVQPINSIVNISRASEGIRLGVVNGIVSSAAGGAVFGTAMFGAVGAVVGSLVGAGVGYTIAHTDNINNRLFKPVDSINSKLEDDKERSTIESGSIR